MDKTTLRFYKIAVQNNYFTLQNKKTALKILSVNSDFVTFHHGVLEIYPYSIECFTIRNHCDKPYRTSQTNNNRSHQAKGNHHHERMIATNVKDTYRYLMGNACRLKGRSQRDASSNGQKSKYFMKLKKPRQLARLFFRYLHMIPRFESLRN